MDEFRLSIYLRHAGEQASYAHTAYRRAMTALAAVQHRYTADEWVDQGGSRKHAAAMEEFWLQIQAMVTCAANVSKLLWGQKMKFKDERADLRAVVGINDSSPLIDTLMRHHFEHFDQRIRLWSELPGMKLYVDKSIGHRDRIVHTEPEPPKTEDFFRSYDPASGDLSFWGEHVSIHEVAAELAQVRDKANQALDPRNRRRE